MNTKEVVKKIEESIKNGKSKEEIFNALSQYHKSPDTLAQLIAMFPTKETAEKYKNLNYILFSLLLLTACLKIFFSVENLLSISPYALITLPIIPALHIWFAVEVWKKRGYIYDILSVLAIVSALGFVLESFIDRGIDPMELLLILIAIISLYLRKKMFPNYNVFGPKKDANGKYVF